ncbi:hypothetical protein AM571_CH01743 [Rhizobium etli 8C-3]|nr:MULTISPECIES: DUF982 domain-containing protein [Rhizobium]APO74565.1 hypothetical protein AM571_CH01743 [Rhizobium etli 8C-3]TCU35236.1 uncharacterized protein DUF982 [Rhizobium azibense]
MTSIAQFGSAVYVHRMYFIDEITSLDEVVDYLENWPEERRGLAYETLLKACHEAAAGRFPVGAVRENFRRFVKKADMLAENQESSVFAN